ncbi:MAG: ribose ABC transporter permease [Planctomycetota bacterium]|jgi:ribose/xylose/arabinose/galactoside ABC-type transport system permease subunit|nr:ribose ABC transporter permease [Planctomycetota bacterium]
MSGSGRTAGKSPAWRKASALLGLIGLCAIMSIVSDKFLSANNLMNILSQIAVVSIVAAGMTFVILTGGIDLSVGSVIGLAGVLSGHAMRQVGNIPLAVAVCVLSGLIMGVINGYLIAYQKLPAFVATLGMMSVARSICFIITQGKPISIFPREFRFFGAGYLSDLIGDVPVVGATPVIILEIAIVFAVAWFLLAQRPFGRYIYSIGSNENATRLAGIDTDFHKLSAYAICGLLTGFAGLLFMGRINSAHPTGGVSYEMNAIAAVVIGGTSLAGGSGSIGGTLIGALIMGVISNGLNLLNVDSYWQGVVLGVAIILAVLVDIKSKRQNA